MQATITPGQTAASIAKANGINVKAVENALARGHIVRPPMRAKRWGKPTVVEMVERKCFACGRSFLAETRFLRSCEPCRTKGSPLGDWGLGVV